VRAGVEARVKAALSQGGLLQAELDGLKACHNQELEEADNQIAQLQEQMIEQQQQLDHMDQELSSSRQALARFCISPEHKRSLSKLLSLTALHT